MNRRILLFLVFLVVLQCTGIVDHSLWTPDEPRVAEIAREMAISGDYLIPQLLYRPFLEKPPLYYAAAGIFYRMFGTGIEGVGRLASVIFALASLAVVFFGIRRLISEESAYLSTIILATSFRFFEISHKMVVDNALVFFVTAALFSYILAHEEKFRYGYVLFWISLAFAFLSKGMIGLFIPGLAIGVFGIWQRKHSFPEFLKRTWIIPGVVIVCAVMVLWAWVLYMRGGMEFIDVFYKYNQLERFIGTGYHGGHVRPFYYYIPTLLADAAPWSVLVLPAVIRARLHDDRIKFFLTWFFTGLILLSVASTKRGVYFLPMYPAMAVLIAEWIKGIAQKTSSLWERGFMWFAAGLIMLCYIVVPAAYIKIGGAWLTACIVFVITLCIFLLVARWKPWRVPYLVCIGWASLLLVWSPVLVPRIDMIKSYKPFFVEAGHIVAQQDVAGYRLTETVEALCPFYGQFYIDSIEQPDIFEQLLASQHDPEYLIVLPSRIDEKLKECIMAKGDMILETKSPFLKKTQLWRMKNKHAGED